MNLRNISIVVSREYLNKVKKKSFLVTTFLVPVLFAALCILPSLIMIGAKEESRTIGVIDKSGVVFGALENTETVSYQDFSSVSLEDAKLLVGEGVDAVISISSITPERTVVAESYSVKPLGVDMVENIGRSISDALEQYRIGLYDIDNLSSIMEDIKVDIPLKTITLGDDGKETVSESGVYMALSMILGMIIYMFIAIFGASVMSSVIEEKSSRVIEVLISSVKATELMFGKIVGVALVALTQFVLWILLAGVFIGAFGLIAGHDMISAVADNPEAVSQIAGGISAPGVTMPEAAGANVILSTLANLPLALIIICFFVFFIFGYLLYASLYAAIGSAVENEGDTQQLQMPITIPLLLGFFIAFYAFKAPESQLVFWGSMIPFTSPIVMLARIPYGVPGWQILLSLALLVATFALIAWFSAKVYRAGILKFGKKSTWKDIFGWVKQRG